MSNRILSVNAYTTLDLVAAQIETHETTLSLDGVVDVTTDDDRPNRVVLGIELDTVAVDAVTPHADRVQLRPDQAESLAESLQEHADEARSPSS